MAVAYGPCDLHVVQHTGATLLLPLAFVLALTLLFLLLSVINSLKDPSIGIMVQQSEFAGER